MISFDMISFEEDGYFYRSAVSLGMSESYVSSKGMNVCMMNQDLYDVNVTFSSTLAWNTPACII